MSYELAGVLGLLVVVLGGTLYYFGLVRGRSPEPEAPLSASVSTGSQDGGAEEIWRPDPEYDEFFAVRVFTDTYDLRRGQEARDRAKANAERLWRFLESKNIPDVFVLAEESRDHGILKLYAGRAASKQSLEGLLTRIKRLEFEGRTQFGSAFVTQAKVKRNR